MNEIHQAAFELRINDLKQIASGGADLSGTLLAACSAHDPDPDLQRRVLRYLVEQGVDVQEADKNGVTPLHRAVRFRSPQAVADLLALGADVNAVDKRSGSTPLHRAVTSTGAPATAGKSDEAMQIVRQLLAAGADRNLKNKDGRTSEDDLKNATLRAVFNEQSM